MIPALILALAIPQGAPTQSVEDRVESTLRQMTLDEKIEILGGINSMYIRAIPRLGLNEVKMSDGPMGVRTWGPTTAYPAGANLAATFDPEMASRFGQAIGRDARARGVSIWLAPGMNLARIPQCGRNFEYFGEDPILAGKIAVGTVKGVQSQGVVATIKHYAANNHEQDRNADDSQVDERTLRELYLKAFEMSVKDGGAWSVMSAYNLLNGVHCSEHDWLQNQVLKKEWGFKGVVMSDWGAVHSTKGALLHGMDLEMPWPTFFNKQAVKPLVQSGEVPESVIDDKVRRILRMGYSMGYYDHAAKDDSLPLDSPRNGLVALQMAREGIVLLKNKGILPLNKSKVKRILVIGPNATRQTVTGGGSGFTEPFRAVTVVDAIKQVAGPNVQVVGRPFFQDSDAFEFSGYEAPGLKAEYFDNRRLEGQPKLVQTETRLDHDWGEGAPAPGLPADDFSVRWTGKYRPSKSGEFVLVTRSDDGIRVWLDGKLVVDRWHERGAETDVVPANLEAGHTYDLKIEYFERSSLAVAQFGIANMTDLVSKSLSEKDLAEADVVVASVGFNAGNESEGSDRSFNLPWGQDIELRKLVSMSPKVVVVNNSGAGIDMTGFADKAAGIVQAWYPGQNGNIALAEILFGETNPSGKLPTTFPRKLEGTYYASAYPPKDHVLRYDEGLFIGYRWFDAHNVKPLYPFGYGLSYTTFRLSNLKAVAGREEVKVNVQLANTGKRGGAEVVQIYAGRTSPSAVTRVKRELKAFKKVYLRAGEKQTVTLNVPIRELAYWDVHGQKWVVEPGRYTLWAGTSSRDLPLTGWIEVK